MVIIINAGYNDYHKVISDCLDRKQMRNLNSLQELGLEV